MKLLSRVLLLAVGLAVLSTHAPVTSRAEEMPIEKTAPGGLTTLEYGGQTFRVNATAVVKIRFEMVAANQIRISLVSNDGSQGKVNLFWVDFQKTFYIGPIPVGLPWEGTLDTEGGFVDR
jgi:hypothetical protein